MKHLLFTVFIVSTTFFVLAAQSDSDTLGLNQWVVKIQDGESIKAIMKSVGADDFKALKIGEQRNYYLLIFKSKSINSVEVTKSLKSNRQILWSEQDRLTKIVKKNLSDPLLSDQWHLNNTSNNVDINAFEAWDLGYSGKGVQICIVDDGIQIVHPDLSPRYQPNLSWDYNSNEPDPSGINGDNHGTACAGVAAAAGNNGTCGAGAAYEANLSGLRLIAAGVPASTEAEALTFRQDSNYIYSNSWGPTDNGQYHSAISIQNAAMEEGVTNGRNGLGSIYVWAAGNGGINDNTNYDPYVNSIYTIGVGAHGNNGVFSSYSEPGASMLVSAPSNGGFLGITTADLIGSEGYANGDCTDDFGGTSSATPLVAGVIALMLEANPLLTWRDIQHLLVENATQIDPNHQDWIKNAAGYYINHNYGFGAVDAEALVLAAIDWDTSPDQLKASSGTMVVDIAVPDATGMVDYSITFDNSDIISLEHVELILNIGHARASDLEIKLISPQGTESVLAEQRNLSTQSFGERKFMTVRNWGEYPTGIWQVVVKDLRSGTVGTWQNAELILYGSGKCSNPTITSQTINAQFEIATDTFLYIEATGAAPLEYQWAKDGINIPNATNDTLHLLNISAADFGEYTAFVTDTCRMVSSESIKVSSPCDNSVSITIQPDNYGSEITWILTDPSNNILHSGGPYTDDDTNPIVINVNLCEGCYDFTIFDSYGDGICCTQGMGTYTINYNGEMITMDSNDPYLNSVTVELCFCDQDTDQDNVDDCEDLCPYDPTKTDPGLCGCGVSDQDIYLNNEYLSDGTYLTSASIFSDGSIVIDREVIFRASNSVLLESDFTVEAGALLDIQMINCSE